MTLLALLLNLVIVAFTFHHARHLNRLVGKLTLKALSKVIALLLAAIAVNMVRRGLEVFL
ncbi:MAG: hypothetical protein ACD_73C00646G0001 [uncultured bacterium]|nr:MAG: hypothetical protein ACD_73C00646G0001 [uncultured bacterium]